MAFDCGGHRYVVLTACYVLAPAFKPDVEALAAVGVITEILANYYVAEIAPVAEEAAAAAESDAAGRWVACVGRLDVGILEFPGPRQQPVDLHRVCIGLNADRAIVEACSDGQRCDGNKQTECRFFHRGCGYADGEQRYNRNGDYLAV